MSSRSFSSLQDLLGPAAAAVAKSTGSAKAFEPIWREVVGDAIARNAALATLSQGRLTVKVTSRQWRDVLRSREHELIERLNARLGSRAIVAVSFE